MLPLVRKSGAIQPGVSRHSWRVSAWRHDLRYGPLLEKEKDPQIKIIGADPPGSVYSGDTPGPYKVEGIGMEICRLIMMLNGRR